MPIKFRCKHCQQLLGISRSRAAALVDCPQCGRSLRVPSLDGTTRAVPNAEESVREDGELLSALTQLSALAVESDQSLGDDDGESTQTENRSLDAGEPLPHAELMTLDEPSSEPIAHIETDAGDELDPQDSRRALSELAAMPGPTDLTAPFDDAATSTGRAGLAWIALAVLIGLSVGWWLGRTTSPNVATSAEVLPVVASDEHDGPPQQNEGIAVTIHGVVRYRDQPGGEVPDASAMVLLLPLTREGSAALNSRSLRREVSHPDHQATLAALKVLGGDFAQADEGGRFVLSAVPTREYVVVAVSRHVARADDLPMPDEVSRILSEYFDSLRYIPGDLAAQAVAVRTGNDAKVTVDLPTFEL